MNRLALSFGFAIAVLWSATAVADPPNESAELDTVTIPLDRIWAYGMPGTSPIRDSWLNSSRQISDETQLLIEIRKALRQSDRNDRTKAGFAVAGSRIDAFRDLHNVLTNDLIPSNSFPAGSEIWLSFFSYQSAAYVHIREVTRQDDTFEIKYEIVPHRTRELTEHVALIPVSKLPVGEFTVKIIRLPMKSTTTEKLIEEAESKSPRRLVCGDYSFAVGCQQHK